jgi:hypothetical protein
MVLAGASFIGPEVATERHRPPDGSGVHSWAYGEACYAEFLSIWERYGIEYDPRNVWG